MKAIAAAALILVLQAEAHPRTVLVDKIGITVKGAGRQFVFTNKEAGFYYGEVNKANTGGWQGWTINTNKALNDYVVRIGNTELDRSMAETIVYPFQLVRKYKNGIEERLTLLDSLNVIVIELVTQTRASLNHLALELLLPGDYLPEPRNGLFDVWRKQKVSPDRFSPSWLIALTVTPNNMETVCMVATGSTIEEARSALQLVAVHRERLILERKERMERLLRRSYVRTDNEEFNIGLAWAKLSLDALIMNQPQSGIPTKGIFAGLPWFNNYWGRDSFISLPGATLVTGNFSDARRILLSFVRFQQNDTSSSDYGRIPNIVNPSSLAYNTADGTPRFVRQLYEYVKYSNDTAIVRDLFPVVKRSIEGTLRYHTDKFYFLTHRDAETWMDAAGPNGPWSPRGNRANDIQAIWFDQLLIGSFFAEYLHEYSMASGWKKIADTLETNFNRMFIDTTTNRIYDHLRADESPASELRPNQLYCFDLVNSEERRREILRSATENLLYDHGVGTLAPSDSNFHPFHHYEPLYVQDAAYHNGIVWPWLDGQAIYVLTRYDLQQLAFPVTENCLHQILERGCVGTLPELLDVFPRRGEKEPRLSGAFSQAWSLAEFIRSFYQDYLGVSADATSRFIRVNPKLPKELGNVEFDLHVDTGVVRIRYVAGDTSVSVSLRSVNLADDYGVSYLWVHENGDAVSTRLTLHPRVKLTIRHSPKKFSVFQNSQELALLGQTGSWLLRGFSPRKEFAALTRVHPVFDSTIKALRGPEYSLLTLEQVRNDNPHAWILFDKEDPIGDDTGSSGTYRYPNGANFLPGILDITGAQVRFDSVNMYFKLQFRSLSNPGWHPEYGFQLTLAAIAINRGSGGNTDIGSNSLTLLDSRHSYERLVLIGGGIRLLGAAGKILCEYLPRPEDTRNPIGNAGRKTVEFSLPLSYLGTPSALWKMTILVGAQDDHSGAGVGEFRTVDEEGGEWIGGGKIDPLAPNVFDTLVLENYR